MKTSNKLLIAFAMALTIIPLLGMIYISQVKYKVGNYTDIVDRKIENFSTETKNMTSVAVATPFTSVNLADGKHGMFIVRLVKDDKFGIKVPTVEQELISTSVDANGQLQILLKEKPKNGGYYTTIYVYAPNVNEVNIADADAAYVTATTDSLHFNANRSGTVGVGSGTHIGNLSISTKDVGNLSFRDDDVKSLRLNLSNTNFTTESNSYENLSIATSGKCDVEIMGDYAKKDKHSIKNLVLHTVGKTDIKMQRIKAVNCTGNFSDETVVQMPAVNLNQMFKK